MGKGVRPQKADCFRNDNGTYILLAKSPAPYTRYGPAGNKFLNVKVSPHTGIAGNGYFKKGPCAMFLNFKRVHSLPLGKAETTGKKTRKEKNTRIWHVFGNFIKQNRILQWGWWG
jgi:hypothetical protein